MDVFIRFLLYVEHASLWSPYVKGCIDAFYADYGYGPCKGDRI